MFNGLERRKLIVNVTSGRWNKNVLGALDKDEGTIDKKKQEARKRRWRRG